MAIKLTVKTNSGIDVQDAYHRVSSIQINNKTAMNFVVTSHKTSNDMHFQESALGCAYDLNGKNPIAQAYEYLKTLPAYAGSVDC
jgi:hypothetical protein